MILRDHKKAITENSKERKFVLDYLGIFSIFTRKILFSGEKIMQIFEMHFFTKCF